MDRLACVDVAALPLQLLLQRQPAWVSHPVAVVEADRPQAPVLFVNERARRTGVRIGQRYAAALGLAGDLRAAVVSRAEIEASVQRLADCLRHYTPHVEPSPDTPGVFWLDAGGLNRLYPSLKEWAQSVRLALQRAGVRATIAVGVSRFGAYALARSYRGIVVCADGNEERAAVRRVALADLGIEADVRTRLYELGVETVGDFLRLPGDGIRQRFGEAADTLYQLAAGRRWSPLVPVPADEPYEQLLHFDTPESSTERLIFIIKRLLDALLASLTSQAQAVTALALTMTLDDRTETSERVAPAAATIDASQLLALVRLRLETLRLSSGIASIRLRAETCRAAPQQRWLLHEGGRDRDAADQALARLRAECGESAVVCARVRDAHLPLARFAWEPVMRVTSRASPRIVAARPLVRRVYAEPVPLRSVDAADVALTVAQGSRLKASGSAPEPKAQSLEPTTRRGPYRVSGGWWGGGTLRDYYFADTDQGNLRWVYYDHRKARLFLQGDVE